MLQDILKTRRGQLLVGAAAVVLAGAAAVYVINRDAGNGTELAAHDCDNALTIAQNLTPQIRGDLAAFRITEEADPLIDLAFKSPQDADIDVGTFAGKTVLLNLWATWCGPCRAEMPSLDRLQAELGSDEFEVVAVNIDTGAPQRALDFLDEIGVTSLAFYADSSTQIFNDLKRRGLALGLPVTLLIDSEGCRLGGVQGPAEWDSEDAVALIEAALET